MGGLPLLFKKEGLIERHQVEGMDPSDRSFNRAVLVNRVAAGYAGKVTYEAFAVEGSRPSDHGRCSQVRRREAAELWIYPVTHTPEFQRHPLPGRKRNLDRLSRPAVLTSQNFPTYEIMNQRAESPNALIPPRGVYTIREQHHFEFLDRINP